MMEYHKTVAITLTVLTIFAISMAFLESSVVYYLRALLTENPSTPVASTLAGGLNIPDDILNVEKWREATTIVMLAAIGIIIGKTMKTRLAAFLWAFGIWDIFYYVFLFVLTGWPPSLMTLDLLFLIPEPWVAPVLIPVAISVFMVAISGAIMWQKIRSVEKIF